MHSIEFKIYRTFTPPAETNLDVSHEVYSTYTDLLESWVKHRGRCWSFKSLKECSECDERFGDKHFGHIFKLLLTEVHDDPLIAVITPPETGFDPDDLSTKIEVLTAEKNQKDFIFQNFPESELHSHYASYEEYNNPWRL